MSVREGLLALLVAGDKHGYQLRTEFEEATAGSWPLNIGQVYTTLERLQRDGLIDEAGTDGDRKRYRLTAQGRAELGDWFSTGPADQPKEPTVIKVLVAMRTEGVDVLAVLDVQRAALTSQLQQHRRAQRKAADAAATVATVDDHTTSNRSLSDLMLSDALITRVESELRWLDMCEQRLATTPKGNAS
jgi:DNA-binding PadR family transcriptional regulator